ncbi:MAG: hypothetical protein KF901_07490 [Myxococcales bacterium]|nr:hypothetical protein [Myxococcales bacterium]
MDKQLGQVISEHHGRLAAGGLGWYVVGIMFVASIVGAGKAIVAGNMDEILYFVIALPVLGSVLFWFFTRWKQTLVIHTEGFEWKRLLRADVVVRYDEIDNVEVTRYRSGRSMHLKGEHTIVDIRLKSGKYVKMTNDIENVEQLEGYAGHSKAATAVAGPPAAASPWG